MSNESRAVLRSIALVVQQLGDPAVLLDEDLVAFAHSVGISQPHTLSDEECKFASKVLLTGVPSDFTSPRRQCHSLVTHSFHPVTHGDAIIGVWISYRAHQASCEEANAREHARAEALEREVAKRTAQLSAALEKVTRLAVVDPLTGLMNRRAFDEHASTVHDLAERHGRHFAVLMCDLDFFKRVNDTYGHGAGDDILVSTAKALKRATRNSDKVARFGGEEFVVLLSETDLGSVEHVAARCAACVRAMPISEIIPGSDFQQTISIGVAIYPQHGTQMNQLLERADRALYEAKSNGRDGVQVYSESMDEGDAENGIEEHSRVLLVEPNYGRASTYRLSLSARFDVVVVRSAEEALDLCARQRFDALVSDEDAAGLSGIEFLRNSIALLPMARRILILAEPDATAILQGTNSAQTDHIITRKNATTELAQSIEHCLLRRLLATQEQRRTPESPRRDSIDGAALDAFYSVLAGPRLKVDYVPILASHSDELVAFHAEISPPHTYFTERQGPTIFQVAEALESAWEVGQLARRSIAIDLPTLGKAQVFLPIHPAELANESIYQDEHDNLLSLMRERIVLSVAEDDFIGSPGLLHRRIARLKRLGYGLAVRSVGSGFASLSTLAALQPDYLQLDVSLLCKSTEEARHRRLIECFIGFAHTEGILTIAQGIQSESDAQFLKGLGFSMLMGTALSGAKHQDFDETDAA